MHAISAPSLYRSPIQRDFPIFCSDHEDGFITVRIDEPGTRASAFVDFIIGNNKLLAAIPTPECKAPASVAFSSEDDCPSAQRQRKLTVPEDHTLRLTLQRPTVRARIDDRMVNGSDQDTCKFLQAPL